MSKLDFSTSAAEKGFYATSKALYPTSKEFDERKRAYNLAFTVGNATTPFGPDGRSFLEFSLRCDQDGVWYYPPQPEWLVALGNYAHSHELCDSVDGIRSLEILKHRDHRFAETLLAGWGGNMLAVEMFLYSVEER